LAHEPLGQKEAFALVRDVGIPECAAEHGHGTKELIAMFDAAALRIAANERCRVVAFGVVFGAMTERSADAVAPNRSGESVRTVVLSEAAGVRRGPPDIEEPIATAQVRLTTMERADRVRATRMEAVGAAVGTRSRDREL
jgi:hypothetical protein